MPVRSVGPSVPAVVEPCDQRSVGELAEPLVVSGKGDSAVRQVDVVERQFAYNACAAGMFGAQRYNEVFKRFARELFNQAHLVIGDGQQIPVYGLALQTCCRVGEDQTILFGVSEQRPQRLDQIVAPVSPETAAAPRRHRPW